MPAEKILIVEDEQSILQLMKSNLEHMGYQVVAAVSTGKEAVDAAGEFKPDVVLMDIELPGAMDGVEAARQIRLEFGIPAIFVTADQSDDAIERSHLAEPLGFIPKPFTAKNLQGAIETGLHSYQALKSRTQQTIQVIEGRYRSLVENMNQGVFRVDHSGRFVFVNTYFANMLGYDSSQELLASSPETKKFFVSKEYYEDLLRFLKNDGGVRDFEFQACQKDGTRIWLSQSVRVLQDPDSPKPYIEGFVQNISERKEAEEARLFLLARQTAILAAVPDIIMEVDSNKVYTWANKAGFEFFGEDVIGKEAGRYFEGDQNTYGLIRPIFEGKDDLVYLESWQRRKDGLKRLLAWRCHVLKDNNGKVTGALSSARDITDLKLAEEALRQSEERFRLITETIDEVFWIADVEKENLAYVSPAFERVWGRSSLKLYEDRNTFREAIHPEDFERLLEAIKIQKTGKPYDCEYRIIRPDGSIRQIWDRGYPIQDESGRVRTYVGVAQDVTAWKNAEKALKKSTDYLNQIINCIGDPVFVKDRQHRFVLTNDASCAHMGMKREDMLGKELDHFMLKKDVIDSIFKQEEQVFKTGNPDISIEDLSTHNGRRYTVMAHKTLLTDSDGNQQIVGVLRDITEAKRFEDALRESEASLASVVSAAQDGIIMLDEEGLVMLFSPAAERITGYPAAEIIGTNFHNRLVPSELQKVHAPAFAAWRQTGQGNVIGKTREVPCLRKDKTEISVELSLSSVQRKGRWMAIGIIRDVTERKRSQTERDQMEVQLRQAQKLEAVGQLAAGIAHEINTPTQYVSDNTRFLSASFDDLTKVMNHFNSLLKANRDGKVDSKLLDEIEAAVVAADLDYLIQETPKALSQSLEGLNRITTIVRAMKEFSHPGGEEKQSIDLNHAIQNTLTVCRNEWKYVAEMALDLDPKLPSISCLPGDINQVILNLVVNAAHAITEANNGGEQGKGIIGVATRLDENWAEIRISDTGTGIPEKNRAKIFTPFFTTKEVGKGTGQGLAISHSVIVGKHGGTLDFETEVGKGTTFIIRLPLSSPNPIPDASVKSVQ